jgi:hypothetical protein
MRVVRLTAYLAMVLWLLLTGAASIYTDLAAGSDVDSLAVVSGSIGLAGLLTLLAVGPRAVRRLG